LNPLIIDTHCHLDDDRYNDDLDEVIARARECGVRAILLPGADIADLPKAREIAYRYDNVFFAAGAHPYSAEDYDEETLLEYLADPKCIAVGECGLDYFRLPKDEEERRAEIAMQKEIFIKHIDLAARLGKPLIVHVRDANEDSYDILRTHAVSRGVRGVMHCYNASRLLLGLDGFYFAVGGVLTFSNAKELVAILPDIPKERLLFETDAPYLTPTPHRGERNEPAYTKLVVEKAAQILGVEFDELARISSENAKRLFGEFESIS
jgi:TatD DNase family protein